MHDKDDVFEAHGVTKERYNWIVDFVYGGIDGAVTTFAVVAGVEGASLSVPIILILGFANLFADGFSMSVGKYLSDRAGVEQFKQIEKTEYEHLKKKTEVERQEIVDILKIYGFKGKDLKKATDVITANPKAWVDLMMRNEFNMSLENVNPLKGAMVTFISFVLIGFMPLIGYVFKPFFGLDMGQTFVLTGVTTLLALFLVGAVKSKFSEKNWILLGIETAFIGGVAAVIAYIVGYLLSGLVG